MLARRFVSVNSFCTKVSLPVYVDKNEMLMCQFLRKRFAVRKLKRAILR